MAVQEHAVHDALVEGIVVADDDLMERYLEGRSRPSSSWRRRWPKGWRPPQVFPVVCGSATKEIAVDRLASFICEIGPSPARPPAGRRSRRATDGRGGPRSRRPALAWVWKTVVDRHVGKISLFKVLSGPLKPDDVLVNSRTHADERLHAPSPCGARSSCPSTELPAGDIGRRGQAGRRGHRRHPGPQGHPRRGPAAAAVPEPALRVAIRPKSKGDEDKLMTALHRLQEEDPALAVRRDDETHQTLLGGMGETHLAIVTERLARKFGVEVETEPVVVPYRETITGTAEAEGKYKKQTGGHGQFGVAFLRIEPLERGAGFEFVDQIVGGAIPRQFIPAVQKGIEEAMAGGGVARLAGRRRPGDLLRRQVPLASTPRR